MIADDNGTAEDAAPRVGQDLIDSVMAVLALPARSDRTAFAKALEKIGQAYATDLWIKPHKGIPGEQRKAVRKLADSIERVLEALAQVSPEYQVALPPMLGRDHSAGDLISETRDNLLAVLEAAILFDEVYAPARGAVPDLELEVAVRDLIRLFSSEGLPLPKALSGRDRRAPRLSSPEAIAIGMLLQGIAPMPTRKLVNMINKVNSGAAPTESHFEAIFRTDPHSELDLCLHPRRRTNERG